MDEMGACVFLPGNGGATVCCTYDRSLYSTTAALAVLLDLLSVMLRDNEYVQSCILLLFGINGLFQDLRHGLPPYSVEQDGSFGFAGQHIQLNSPKSKPKRKGHKVSRANVGVCGDQ